MEGAAFSNPSSGKIDQQRQILEDLKRQQKLLKSGTGSGLLINSIPTTQPSQALLDSHIPTGQRTALESANKSSFGFFIPQDSSFDIKLTINMARMKLKELECHLQEVDEFDEPKILLEQYPTRPHIAACMIHTMASAFGDIEDRSILDLGCGSGVLTIGCVMLGAATVLGLDIDTDALDTCQQNLEAFDIDNVDLVNGNVADADQILRQKFDVVLMNPPFGTKHNKGLDLLFVEKGIKLATRAVYSLHKTCTREHVLKKGEAWGTKPQVLAELRYDLPATYKHHKKASVDIEVDFIRFAIS